MHWKVNHMVVPKAEALKCDDRHGKDGRMERKALGYAGDPRCAKKPAVSEEMGARAA